MKKSSLRMCMRSNRTGNRAERAFEAALSAFPGATFQAAGLPGRPDAAFRRERVAVFMHGCFWHSCPRHGSRPRSNAAFWRRKFEANRRRDVRAARALRRLGWSAIAVWEHDLKSSRWVGKVRRALERRRKGSNIREER